MTDVKGYMPLSDDQKALANEFKEMEERFIRFAEQLMSRCNVEGKAIHDNRCLALAITNMQTASMFAVRGIFKPQRIKLPEDE